MAPPQQTNVKGCREGIRLSISELAEQRYRRAGREEEFINAAKRTLIEVELPMSSTPLISDW